MKLESIKEKFFSGNPCAEFVFDSAVQNADDCNKYMVIVGSGFDEEKVCKHSRNVAWQTVFINTLIFWREESFDGGELKSGYGFTPHQRAGFRRRLANNLVAIETALRGVEIKDSPLQRRTTEQVNTQRKQSERAYRMQYRLDLTAEDKAANEFLWIHDKLLYRDIFTQATDNARESEIFKILVR